MFWTPCDAQDLLYPGCQLTIYYVTIMTIAQDTINDKKNDKKLDFKLIFLSDSCFGYILIIIRFRGC